jgi:hypothetical protein
MILYSYRYKGCRSLTRVAVLDRECGTVAAFRGSNKHRLVRRFVEPV